MSVRKLVRITTIPIALEKLLENQLRFMSDHYDLILVAANREHLERVGKSQNARVHPVEMTRQITPLQDLKALWHMYRFFRKEQPFIVHTHTPKAGIIGMLAARLAGVPHRLHTVAGLPLLEASGGKRKVLDFVEKLTYACATKVYPNSNGLRAIIEQLRYCPSQKLKVIGNGSSNGINTDYFDRSLYTPQQRADLRRQWGIADTDFVFVFVGRIVRDKGMHELVDAFKLLENQYPQMKLLLVGDYEPELDPLNRQAMDFFTHSPKVVCTGWVQDVRPFLAISHALVFPSYREGFPNVVMQAGAMDLPVIVSDINGCNEIVEDGVNGLIVPVKNAEALRQAMEKLLSNPGLYAQLSGHARHLIVSRYRQQHMWSLILDEYRALEAAAV